MDAIPPALLQSFANAGVTDPNAMQAMMPMMSKMGPAEREKADDLDEEKTKRMIEDAETAWKAELVATPTPFVPPLLGRLSLKEKQTNAREFLAKSNEYLNTNTFIGQDKFFSTAPMASLTPVTLREMKCHQVHKGKYLLCRTFLESARTVATELYVEDVNGDTIFVGAYNLPGLFQAGLESLDAHLPVGTVLAIREPWMKTSGIGGFSNAMIRVDSPTDIVFLSSNAKVVRSLQWKTALAGYHLLEKRSALDWKNVGNAHFKKKLLIPAIMAWTHAFHLDPTMIAIPLNRTQAYLALKWHGPALAETRLALSMAQSDNDTFKATYRAACAEYGLGLYQEALVRFQSLAEHPDTPDAPRYATRCECRLREQGTGSYDFQGMYRASAGRLIDLDVANYVSSAIRVTSLSQHGGGRGVETVREIKAGELLMVTKPFASAAPEELKTKESIMGLDFATRRMQDASHVAVINRIIARLVACPHEAGRFDALYAGRKFPSPPASYDLSQPLLSGNASRVDPLEWGLDVDVSKVDAILSFNAFRPAPLKRITKRSHPSHRMYPKNEELSKPIGLYLSPSLFNHACNANAHWYCLGNVMLVRALGVLPPGTEITVPYVSCLESYFDRGKTLDSILDGRRCECALCAADRADGAEVCATRKAALDELQDRVRSKGLNTDRQAARKLVDKVQKTYSPIARSIPLPELFFAQATLTQVIEHQGNAKGDMNLIRDSIQHGLRALAAAGFQSVDQRMAANRKVRYLLPLSKDVLSPSSIADHCIAIMAHLGVSFFTLSETICSERWYRAAWWAHDAYYGGGKALFDLLCVTEGMPMPDNMEYRWE